MTSRLGLVGSGYMASEYLKAAKALDNLEFVSIFSRNSKTSHQLADDFQIDVVANNIAEFCDLNLDFVVICVPELATEKIILECASLNIPLLVEKPVGLNFSQGKKIEEASKEAGIEVFAALNRRFYSSTLAVMSEVSDTSTPRFVNVIDQENTFSALKAGQPIEVVENWMYANSIHIIDYISFICRGGPHVTSKKRVSLGEGAFIMQAEISYSSGDAASYICFWNSAGGWSVSINVDTQTWQLSPLESSRTRHLDDRHYTDFPDDPIDKKYKPGLVRILQEVAKHINGEPHSLPSIEDANRTMKLIEMIYFDD